MVRKLINDVPMTPSQRNSRSKEERLARGERLLHQWLSPEAAQSLDFIIGPDAPRGAITEAVNEALIFYAKRKKRV